MPNVRECIEKSVVHICLRTTVGVVIGAFENVIPWSSETVHKTVNVYY